MTPDQISEAMAETARLRRDMDITNADHIALWLEANTIQDEPMSQCISWLACRIVDAHEAALKAQQPDEAMVDILSAAYDTGATDVHNSWVAGTNDAEPDFGEAAKDYARAAIAAMQESRDE